MVPVFKDVETGKVKVWAFLGWSRAELGQIRSSTKGDDSGSERSATARMCERSLGPSVRGLAVSSHCRAVRRQAS